MLKITKILLIILSLSWFFAHDETSKYYYLDSIDEIKSLEKISEQYLEMGDTLNAINALIELTDRATLSELSSDTFISGYLYRIGDLFLLLNDLENAEKYLLLSVDIYNQNKIKNQLLMGDPLLSLQKIYKNDSLKLKTIASEIEKINELEKITVPDSLKYEMITLNSFEDNINIQSEYFVYDNLNVATSLFYNELYAQSAEMLNKSLDTFSDEISLDYYYNLSILDSINIEFLYPAFNLLIEQDSLYDNGYFFLSIMDFKLKKNINALKYANQYSKKRPNDFKGYELIGDIYFDNQNWYDAIFHYQRTLLRQPNDLDLQLKIALCLIKENFQEQAINFLEEIISNDEYYEEAYYQLGRLYLLNSNYKKSIELLKKYLLLNPNNKEGYYSLALSYMKLNNYNFALESFKKVLLLDELDPDAHYYLAIIFESILDYEQAIFHYTQAKRHGCNHPKLNLQYGTLLYNLNYFQKAANPLKDYLMINNENLDVLKMLGEIYYKELRYGETIDIYKKLIFYYPENINFKIRIAQSFYELKSYQESIEIYENILIDMPEDVGIMITLGNIHYEIQSYERAIYFYNSVLECSGGNADVLYSLALAYIESGNFLQSLIVFKRASLLEPDNEIIQYQIGVTYVELGLYEQALKYFIQYNQNDADSRFMSGFCYYKLKEYDKAINFFDLYLKLQDNNTEIDYYKGLCYYYLNNFKEAATYLKKVTKSEGQNAIAFFHLGLSYLQLNKKREAKKVLNNLYYINITLHDSLNNQMNQ